MQTIALKDFTKAATDTKALTNAAAAAAGLAATGWLEPLAFRAVPQVFGTNDGDSAPSMGQNVARHGFRVAEVLTGLVLVSKGSGYVRAAGYGMAAGGAWHITRELLPVVNPS